MSKSNNRGFIRSNPKEITYLHFDMGDDYYYVSKQIDVKNDRRFIDRSAATGISSSSSATGFFSSSPTPKSGSSRQSTGWVPSWQQAEQYLTGSIDPKEQIAYNVDFFRNGVELLNLNQWAAGYVKISAGTPGHIIDNPSAFGTLRDNSNVTENWYRELDYFNPLSFIASSSLSQMTTKFTYPVIITDAEETDKNGYNGVIEAFTIRDVVTMNSITGIQEPRSIKGSFGNGNQRSPWEGSEEIVTIREFTTNNEAIPFIDQFDFETGYYGENAKKLLPYVDIFYPRDHVDESSYESDLLAVVGRMSSLDTTYIREKERSQACGFVYDNAGLTGTDSVAFGGLLY